MWSNCNQSTDEMLELSEEALTFGCTECSYRAIWPFQLAHHVQRNCRHFDAVEPFLALDEPQQYSCISCGFENYNKLRYYEHWVSAHGPQSVGNETPFYKEYRKYPCDTCEHKGHSCLILIKHLASCSVIPENITADTIAPSLIEHDVGNSDLISSAASSASNTEIGSNEASERHKSIGTIRCSRTILKAKVKRQMLSAATHAVWFNCSKCSYRSKDKESVRTHMLTHAEAVAWFSCLQCSQQFKQNCDLKTHMLIHASSEDAEWFSCDECPYSVQNKRSLYLHMLRWHAPNVEIECSGKISNKLNFNQHATQPDSRREASPKLGEREAIENLVFDESSTRFMTKEDVPTPAANDQTNAFAAKNVIDWFGCTKCSYRGEQNSDLERHMLTHTSAEEIKSYSCTEGPLRFSNASAPMSHLKCTTGDFQEYYATLPGSHRAVRHTQEVIVNLVQDESGTRLVLENRFPISAANNQINAPAAKGEINAPAGKDETSWFSCTKCSYRGKQNSDLEGHSPTHTTAEEIEPYSCTEYPSRSTYAAELTSHLEYHATRPDSRLAERHVQEAIDNVVLAESGTPLVPDKGEDKGVPTPAASHEANTPAAQCEIGAYASAAESEIDWFSCTECSFRCKRNENLKRHVSTTHNAAEVIKSYSCTECPLRFPDASTLKNHLRYYATRPDSHRAVRQRLRSREVIENLVLDDSMYVVPKHLRPGPAPSMPAENIEKIMMMAKEKERS